MTMNGSQLSREQEDDAEAEHREREQQVDHVLAGEHDRRALEQAELVLARELAERDHRARERDRADERADEQLDAIAVRESPRRARARAPNADGSATAAYAMNTAARPISECMAATSSGILVISTRLAMTRRPRRRSAASRPSQASASRSDDQRAVVTPRWSCRSCRTVAADRRVGCDSPLSAWMKQTLAQVQQRDDRLMPRSCRTVLPTPRGRSDRRQQPVAAPG